MAKNETSKPKVRVGLHEMKRSLRKALDSEAVTWSQLVKVDSFRANEDEAWRRVGEKYYQRVLEAFEKQNPGVKVAMFGPVGGVYALDSGDFGITMISSNIGFDWSAARRLAFEVDTLADEAKEWWRPRPRPEGGSKFLHPFRRLIASLSGRVKAADERRPHTMRAYSLATWLVGAVRQENNTIERSQKSGLPPPSAAFTDKLTTYRTELRSAQSKFRMAAQRTAQSRYWQGAMVGAFGLTVLCAALGAVFWWRGASAAYGVAVPAGGLGAMVSLLQRMSSGKLKLDFEASRDLIEVFGAVRPFIGAIFGIALTALLLGNFIPAIEIPPHHELAFFAGLGFLAGFNERWAQDMLKSTSEGIGGGEAAKKVAAT